MVVIILPSSNCLELAMQSSCRDEISEHGGILLSAALTPHLLHAISSWHDPLDIEVIVAIITVYLLSIYGPISLDRDDVIQNSSVLCIILFCGG